jgi:mycofactocin glycosyltransferase
VPEQPPPAPPGLRLRPDQSLRSLDGGRVLLGGSPYRLLRLGPAGARQVAAWWRGEPVPDSPAALALARRLLETGLAQPDPAGLPGPGPDEVTVVIPVRDRPRALARCLDACAGQRVIVVDDGSADPGATAAVAARAGARCLRLPASLGPGGARNAGLAAAPTPFVAFVDSDCVPRPGWLTPLLAHFADPAVAAAGPRIVPAGPVADGGCTGGTDGGSGGGAGGTPGGWLAAYERARSALDMGPAPSLVRPGARVPYLPAAALVVRRDRAGPGFAADMPVGEDVDFVWRLAEGGWQVRYEPASAVAHAHRVRLAAWFRRRVDYGSSAAPLELRHPGRVPAVSMSGWSALAWLAVAAGRPAVAASLLGGTTALLARRLAPVTEDAWPVALRLAGGGTVMAGRLLGRAVSRAWWPAAVPAAIALPRLRGPLAALVLAAPLLDWREQRPPLDPVRYAAARLLDDLAYSLGVWRGCLEHRTARPLRPVLWWWSRRAEPGGPAR